ncbi:hypothetical protein TPA0907_51150 [Micromonospora humidisoli]|nr:hypothetical protein TPA0907_51150 [Micromonospora sp. AKA109]
MVTSRLPDSTPPAPAVADGFPAGRDGLAGGAVGSGTVVAVGVAASEGVAGPDGVAVPDPAGVPPPSPQAISAPEHASTATPVIHFNFDMLCSSAGVPAGVRGLSAELATGGDQAQRGLDAHDHPPVSS